MDGRYDPIDSPDETTVFPYHDLTPPSTADVIRARQVVDRHLPETPLVRSEHLSAVLDADVYLKREDTLPTGAFKVRGGVNLVASLPEEFHEQGLIAASSGNHGQSIAWAGRAFDVPVTIAVPEGTNAGKVAAMEQFGAEVISHGPDYDAAREHIESMAAETGRRYVHSGNEPKLLAGVGTAGLEIVETLPDVDRLFCPVGGGTSAAGYCLTVGALTDADVVGVQSAAAPAMHRAYHEDTLEPHDRMETRAEGVATRVPFALTMGILRFPTRLGGRHRRRRGPSVHRGANRHGGGLCDERGRRTRCGRGYRRRNSRYPRLRAEYRPRETPVPLSGLRPCGVNTAGKRCS